MTHGAVLCTVREVDRRHPTVTKFPLNSVAAGEGGFEVVQEIGHHLVRWDTGGEGARARSGSVGGAEELECGVGYGVD